MLVHFSESNDEANFHKHQFAMPTVSRSICSMLYIFSLSVFLPCWRINVFIKQLHRWYVVVILLPKTFSCKIFYPYVLI